MIDQYSTLSEKFLRKGFWLYLFSFIMAPIWYIIKIILSGELTVSEVGILYGIISLIWLLSAFNDLWMTESLNYFIPKFISKKRYDKVKSILFYALSTQIITSIIIAGFFYFGADYIANNYFETSAAKETLKVFAFFFIWINIFSTIWGFCWKNSEGYSLDLIQSSIFFILFLSEINSLIGTSLLLLLQDAQDGTILPTQWNPTSFLFNPIIWSICNFPFLPQ